jgi:BMFP domain-containing protein YqiC
MKIREHVTLENLIEKLIERRVEIERLKARIAELEGRGKEPNETADPYIPY